MTVNLPQTSVIGSESILSYCCDFLDENPSFPFHDMKTSVASQFIEMSPFLSTATPSPPVNLSHVQTIDGELMLRWHSPPHPSKLGPLRYQVRYSANATHPSWQVNMSSGHNTAPGHYRSSALTLIPCSW